MVDVALSPDRLERAVWVVVDPRDFVTGQRMVAPVLVRLADVAATPLAGRSGVYGFMDLDVPAASYTARVEPLGADRTRYFASETSFVLQPVPVPGQPLQRNLVTLDLLPRPAYPFPGQSTLARGRLVRASASSGLEGARIGLVIDGNDLGLRGRTDERGAFVVFFPPIVPDDDPHAGLKTFPFQLRFEIDGSPPHVTPQAEVIEGQTIALAEIQFPGL
jgi:hypothetical protein